MSRHNTNSPTETHPGERIRKNTRPQYEPPNSPSLMVNWSLKDYSTKVGEKKHKHKGGEEITEDIYEDYTLPSPAGYAINLLRSYLRHQLKPVLAGERKKIEITLERFPQVETVAGEIKASTSMKFKQFGYSSKDEQNTLFVVEVA
jgi:hypothetical protein